jgi:malonyl-CoA O-methyltransferase
VLDKRRIRTAFERAAPGFDDADFLHSDLRGRLLNRLGIAQIEPEFILDLGAGTGAASAGLAAHYPDARIIAVDFAAQMLAAGRHDNQTGYPVDALCADGARLPIADASIDLIFSNLMLHHCPDPVAVLTEARRVLRFPGLLIFTTFGPDSLIELRSAWAGADDRSHVFEFTDMHHIGDALIRSGFAEPVLDVETLTITYEHFPRLMADLRGVGSINATDNRNPGLTGKKNWQRMSDAYEQYRDAEGRLPVTLEIVYGLGWCGQPEPRRTLSDGGIEIPIENLHPGSYRGASGRAGISSMPSG